MYIINANAKRTYPQILIRHLGWTNRGAKHLHTSTFYHQKHYVHKIYRHIHIITMYMYLMRNTRIVERKKSIALTFIISDNASSSL